jgi:Domain of unknown function (DUF4342)
MFTDEKVLTVETPTLESPQVETPKVETVQGTLPVTEIPTAEAPQAQHSWVEEIEIASDQLVARVKELIAEGNVRRLIIRAPDNKVFFEIPLTAGVAVGGVVTLFAPLLAALGALAALIARVKVEIVREGNESRM